MAETQNKLPISFDVTVSLSKAQVAVGKDMTTICFCTPNVDFLHGDRVKTFLTSDSFNKITTTGSSVYWAGQAFFAKTKRPAKLAVGRIYTTDQEAYLLSGGIKSLTELASISDGAFDITVNGTVKALTGLDFTGVTDISGVANVINTALTDATCAIYKDNLIIKTNTTGDEATISYATEPTTTGSGITDISGLLGLTEATGASYADGYTAGTISEELQGIADAATRAGLFFYGWTLDSEYRDTEDQEEATAWINARSFRAIGAMCTNNANAYNPASTSNNGYKATEAGLAGINYTYDDNPQVYPEISYLANFLAVDYNQENSTIAGKYKDADGISAVNFPDIETNVQTLNARRINTITGVVGQTIKFFREGNQSSSIWSTDGWVNVCNFINDIEIEILNVFLRNKKVPYTPDGQNLLIAAASKVCNKYKRNGSFSDGMEEDSTSETGYRVIPAFDIAIQEISATTAAQRAAHIGTPMTITVNDAGWMGSIAINVDVLA